MIALLLIVLLVFLMIGLNVKFGSSEDESKSRYILNIKGVDYNCTIEYVHNNAMILVSGGGAFASWYTGKTTVIVTSYKFEGEIYRSFAQSYEELNYEDEKVIELSKKETMRKIESDHRAWNIGYKLI